MSNECQKPEIRAHRATEWSVIKQRCEHTEGPVVCGVETGHRRGQLWRREHLWGRDERPWGGGGGSRMKMLKIQLLSSSSVAVSTSQDFDDNATITAFWKRADKYAVKERDISAIALKRERERCALFQSPWHRVCLFCVCIPDWKQERPRRRETRAWPSV